MSDFDLDVITIDKTHMDTVYYYEINVLVVGLNQYHLEKHIKKISMETKIQIARLLKAQKNIKKRLQSLESFKDECVECIASFVQYDMYFKYNVFIKENIMTIIISDIDTITIDLNYMYGLKKMFIWLYNL